jgi:hypothetical protein
MKAKFVYEGINDVLQGPTEESIMSNPKWKELQRRLSELKLEDYPNDDYPEFDEEEFSGSHMGEAAKEIIQDIFGNLPTDPDDPDMYHPMLIKLIEETIDFSKVNTEEFWEGMIDMPWY